jgi:alpha-L-rhamnosidase
MVVENVTFLQAFGDPRLNARCLRLAVSQRRPDGLIPGVCPAEAMDRYVLVATNLFLPLMLEEYLLYTGDEALVKELMPLVEQIFRTFRGWQDATGVATPPKALWNFVDWSYPSGELENKPTAVLSFFHVLALDSTARLLERLGRPGEAPALRAEAERIAQAADRRFWSEESGCYAEWIANGGGPGRLSQLSHAVALLSGRVPAARRSSVTDALNREDLLKPELYLHHFVLRALAAAGRAPDALDRIRKYWGNIVLAPSPTIWENGVNGKLGKEAFGGVASMCHGFATTPVSFLQSTVLGVVPLEPGFRVFAVKPEPCGLQYASGSVPTPHGNIELSWKRAGAGLKVELRVPPSTAAQLPDGRRLPPGHWDLATVTKVP